MALPLRRDRPDRSDSPVKESDRERYAAESTRWFVIEIRYEYHESRFHTHTISRTSDYKMDLLTCSK